MKISTMLRGGATLALGVALIAQPIAAAAQTVPGGPVNTGQPAAVQQSAGAPGYVLLGDLPPSGGTPHAARNHEIDRNTPAVSRDEFVRRYPAQGEAGYNRIASANADLCGEANAIMDEIALIQAEFAKSDLDYVDLQGIYEQLPKSMKRHAVVTSISQAASSGLLCALSAGLYCIAAAVSGGGNILQIHGSLKMQLANIRLSQANIRLSRTTIRADMVWARATTLWVRMASPFCRTYYPNARRQGW